MTIILNILLKFAKNKLYKPKFVINFQSKFKGNEYTIGKETDLRL